MSISKIRGWLYWTAKLLGHVQAGNKAARTKSIKPITTRVARVFVGKLTARMLGRMF